MESVAISTSARGAVLSWKDWGEGGRRGKGGGGREEEEGRRRKGGERSTRSMRDSTKAHLGTTGNMDELFSFMQACVQQPTESAPGKPQVLSTGEMPHPLTPLTFRWEDLHSYMQT